MVPSLPPALLSRAARFLPWLFGLVAFGIAQKNLIGGYGDLGIYLDVARELMAGGQELCRERPGSGPWTYPHAAALPFAGLLAAFGDAGARWVWCAGLGVATGWLVHELRRVLQVVGGLAPWQWCVCVFLFQRCIAQNLTHGQLSLWVGACVVAGTAALGHGQDRRAGVWLGLAAALKLTPALFLLALPLMRRGAASLVMAATIVVVVLLLPWPVLGTGEHLRHLAEFGRAAFASVADPDRAAIVQSYAGPSVKGAFDYLLQPRPLDQGRTVNLFVVGDHTLLVVKLVWSLGLLGLLAAWFWRARRLPSAPRLVEQAAVVAMAFSFFAPLVRTYHLAAAMVPFALFCRGPRDRRDWLWWGAALATTLALTLRQKKLLGETLWRAFDGGALLHLAMVGCCLWSCRRVRRAAAT